MKVLSFSLYGDNPLYAVGRIKNADLHKKYFTDWEMRVYHNNTVPKNILIDRDKIKNNLPIVTAKPEYSFFDLLYLIEMTKEVHVISSCFLSFFMVKKINKNIFAHMYADRSYLSEMIKKNNIEVIL
jgi:hypothetical protein